MAPDDAQDRPDGGAADQHGGAGERPQDPIVERRRPDPTQLPVPTLTMAGFLGDSDREGCRRLYFSSDLDYYAEFRVDDVVEVEAIPAGQAPFRGEQATRLTLRRGATVEYTRVRTARPVDEFDLDVRFGRRRGPIVSARLPEMTPPGPGCLLPMTPGDVDCPNTPGTCAPGADTCGTCTWEWQCGATCEGQLTCPCPVER